MRDGTPYRERSREFWSRVQLEDPVVAGAGSVAYLIESIHGAGPPTAQRIMIGRQGDVEGKVEKAKRLLGI